jgi:hypothetical protein
MTDPATHCPLCNRDNVSMFYVSHPITGNTIGCCGRCLVPVVEGFMRHLQGEGKAQLRQRLIDDDAKPIITHETHPERMN